jgi:ribosomal protein S18 acetylase RimI-like enzyme
VTLQEAEIASPELSQFLFTAVGLPWRWFSRLSWTYQDWLDYLTKEQVRTFVLYQRGTPAGFAELWRHPAPVDTAQCQPTDSVELKFFGLLPAFTGQGLGQLLAQAAVAHAQRWCDGPVWLHTCSDDHPAALATYQKAGFVITETTQEPSAAVLDYPQAALAQPFVLSRLQRYAP